MGTGIMPGQIWAPEWFPGTYEQAKDAMAHMGTGMVPRHI